MIDHDTLRRSRTIAEMRALRQPSQVPAPSGRWDRFFSEVVPGERVVFGTVAIQHPDTIVLVDRHTGAREIAPLDAHGVYVPPRHRGIEALGRFGYQE